MSNTSFTVACWNVNSVRVRLPAILEFIEQYNPDILFLQELKCDNPYFPHDAFSNCSYNIYVHGQKSNNGVAIFSKIAADEVINDFPNNPCKEQARFLEIRQSTPLGFCRFISLYAPNGGDVDSSKFIDKLEFYNALTEYIRSTKSLDEILIMGGDLNIAPFDIDVYSPKELVGSTGFTLVERQKLRELLFVLDDTYRILHKDKRDFSWWDYRGNSFEHNKGMRIDAILATDNAINHLDSASIAQEFRAKPQASDHAPVVAKFLIQ